MSMQVTNTLNNISWETLLSPLGNVTKTGSVDGRSTFTITSKEGDSVTTSTISIPDDLEIPATVDQGTLEGLVDKLAATGLGFTPEQISQMKDSVADLYAKAADAVKTVNAKSSGAVLFDLYALMALMIDVAQSQRDAQREIRTAQNLAIQNAIQNQADEQRSAAMTGMMVGIISGAATALASITTMALQGVSASTQSKLMQQSGADSAKMHSSMLQNTDTIANAQTKLEQTTQKVGNEVATSVNREFTRQINDDTNGNLHTKFTEAMDAFDLAKEDVVHAQANVDAARTTLGIKQGEKMTAQTEVDQKTQIVTQKQQRYDQAKANEQTHNQFFGNNEGTRAVEAAKAELDTAKAELDTAQQALNRATEAYTTADNNVATCQRDLANANTKLTQAQTNLVQARNDYSATVRSVASQYEEAYQTAVDRMNNPPEGSNKAQLKADVAAAKTKMEMAFAKEARLLADHGVMTPAEQRDMLAAARLRVDTTMDRVTQRADFKAAERKMSTLMGINNINQSIGGVLQSTAANLASLRSAEATRTGADKTKEEEMLDQTKDLFQQEQTLINQVVQLYAAVIQAESQSMRDAIQA